MSRSIYSDEFIQMAADAARAAAHYRALALGDTSSTKDRDYFLDLAGKFEQIAETNRYTAATMERLAG